MTGDEKIIGYLLIGAISACLCEFSDPDDRKTPWYARLLAVNVVTVIWPVFWLCVIAMALRRIGKGGARS